METSICASEKSLIVSTIGVNLTSKFGTIVKKCLLNLFDISLVPLTVKPLILSDVTDFFPGFQNVNLPSLLRVTF